MKCFNSSCEKELSGRQSRFCSDRCRKQVERKSDKLGQNSKVGQKSDKDVIGTITIDDQAKGLTEMVGHLSTLIDFNKVVIHTMSRSELYLAINSYPADTWKDSSEFKELMHRLKTKTVAELKLEGYYIPSWKYKECA